MAMMESEVVSVETTASRQNATNEKSRILVGAVNASIRSGKGR